MSQSTGFAIEYVWDAVQPSWVTPLPPLSARQALEIFFWGLTYRDWHNQIALDGTGEK